MNIQNDLPKLLAKIDEEVFDARELVVVDYNYDDIDSDEFDVFDPSEYNFMVYVPKRVRVALGEERLISVVKRLKESGDFQEFYVDDIDMYGVMTKLSEEDITKRFLTTMEDSLS